MQVQTQSVPIEDGTEVAPAREVHRVKPLLVVIFQRSRSRNGLGRDGAGHIRRGLRRLGALKGNGHWDRCHQQGYNSDSSGMGRLCVLFI